MQLAVLISKAGSILNIKTSIEQNLVDCLSGLTLKGQLISKQNCRAVTSRKIQTKRTQDSILSVIYNLAILLVNNFASVLFDFALKERLVK